MVFFDIFEHLKNKNIENFLNNKDLFRFFSKS